MIVLPGGTRHTGSRSATEPVAGRRSRSHVGQPPAGRENHRPLPLIGPALIAIKGHGAPEVVRTYNRARELCEHIGDTQRLSRVLAGLCAYYTARGPYTTAYEMAEQALLLAERRDEPRLLLTAQTNLGVNAFLLGRFTAAQDHLEKGMALAAVQPRGKSSSQDFGVTCCSYSALTLFSLGYPEQALELSLIHI